MAIGLDPDEVTMRLLVTGATGFLGSELVPRLVKAGHEVVALVREPQRYARTDGVQVVKGDITAFDLGLKTTAVKVDAVFHLAAMVSFKESDRDLVYEVNCNRTSNVVHYCLNHRVGRLLYASTAYVCGDYGKSEWLQSHYNQGQRFRNHYERSKFLAQGYLREAAKGFGIHDPLGVTIFRPSIIVGRASDGHATTFEGFYKPVWAMARVMALVESRLPPRERVEAKLHLPPLRVPISIHGDPPGHPQLGAR